MVLTYPSLYSNHTCATYCGTGCDAPTVAYFYVYESQEERIRKAQKRHHQSLEQQRIMLEKINERVVYLYDIREQIVKKFFLSILRRQINTRHKSRQVRLYA